ncbi:MAG: P-loop NTPase, partial [Candidatus Limnocylindrales bacterium]
MSGVSGPQSGLSDEIQRNAIPHLRGQFAQARPVLFLGAGFSQGLRNVAGRDVPTGSGLTELIWQLCFPGAPFEPGTTLQDVFQEALLRRRRELKQLLEAELTIDVSSVEDWQRFVFSLPWYKVYTLNVDDMEAALARKFEFSRRIKTISAADPTGGLADSLQPSLDVIHLNGTIADVPDRVTFSQTQYAERSVQADPWYSRLAAEMATQPFVFIGTRLDEAPLWQHIEMRRFRGLRHLRREYRPRSYLVTPHLNRARQALLDEFHVLWVPMEAHQFARDVLSQLEPGISQGHDFVARVAAFGWPTKLIQVGELASTPQKPTEFLGGVEPEWSDLQSGRAIPREGDDGLLSMAREHLGARAGRRLAVITGTAGSGKSVGIRRAALALTADGYGVGWVGRDAPLTPRDIRRGMQEDSAPDVLCIDDADDYGSELAPIVLDVVSASRAPLVIVALRPTRIAQVLPQSRLPDVRIEEFTVPLLGDGDIDALLDVLTRENRLGILRGMGRKEQRSVFESKADRQLLVAMIEATSGERFEAKIFREYDELDPESQFVYACVATASTLGVSLSRQDLLVAAGDRSNEALERLSTLVRGHVLLAASHGVDLVRARHRAIADRLRQELQRRRALGEPMIALGRIAGSKVRPGMRSSDAPWRFAR